MRSNGKSPVSTLKYPDEWELWFRLIHFVGAVCVFQRYSARFGTLAHLLSWILLSPLKKDTQIKQLRRELAQLLESGQTQTALIRVEHVVREEKTVAAYELIDIYCELIVVRLVVIDSQKTCPNDLKEAVASVLYVSKRLSDVAKLADVVKHFSAKYGKDFVSAAVGLQSDSGVSRLLVDKLSVKAPDGPTKNKTLKEIATEHNVTWEPESLVEPDPKETVLMVIALLLLITIVKIQDLLNKSFLLPRSSYREEEDQSTTRAELSKKNVDEQSENASWKRVHSRDNSLEKRQSDSFAKVGRAKQQPIKDDVNGSCSEDVQLKKQSSLASS
ncbi:unnamed protein product, partial [Brassica oleracea]